MAVAEGRVRAVRSTHICTTKQPAVDNATPAARHPSPPNPAHLLRLLLGLHGLQRLAVNRSLLGADLHLLDIPVIEREREV